MRCTKHSVHPVSVSAVVPMRRELKDIWPNTDGALLGVSAVVPMRRELKA